MARLALLTTFILLAACASGFPVQTTEGDGWRWLGGTELVPSQLPVNQVNSAEDFGAIWAVGSNWDTGALPEADFATESVVIVDSLGGIFGDSICTARVVDVEPAGSGVVRLEVRSSTNDDEKPCALVIVNSLVLLALDRSVFGEPPYSIEISYD